MHSIVPVKPLQVRPNCGDRQAKLCSNLFIGKASRREGKYLRLAPAKTYSGRYRASEDVQMIVEFRAAPPQHLCYLSSVIDHLLVLS